MLRMFLPHYDMGFILLLCVCISLWTCTNSQTLGNKITSQVSKDCVLVIEDKEVKINEITNLLKMDTVHMIDIQLFSGPNCTEPFFSQYRITLVDEWGREVISLLDFKYFIVTSTLTVGHIEQFNLRVNENYEGCIKAEKNPMNFLAGSLLKQFIVKLPMTSSQICYVPTHPAESSQANRTCCKLIENYDSNCQCKEDQYQHGTFDFLSLPHIRTCLVLGAFLFIFVFYFILSTEDDEYLSQEALNTYYRLNENTISILYYIRFISWDDCGERVSIIRRFVLVTFCLGVYLWHIQPLLSQNWLVAVALDIVFGIWVPLVYVRPSTAAFSPSLYEHRHQTPKWLVSILQLLKYDVHGICQGHYIECVSVKKLICLPFTIDSWKETSKTLKRKVSEKIRKCFEKMSKYFEKKCQCFERIRTYFKEMQPSTSFKNIFDHCRRLIVTPFYLLYIGLVFILMIFLIIVTLLAKPCLLLKNLICERRNSAQILNFTLYLIILITSSLIVSIITLLTWLPFLLGLLCNITYFIPYITVILVSFYYMVQFWKSFNSEYSALKMFIYKEYQERKLKKGIKEPELKVAEKELEIAKTELEIAEEKLKTVKEENTRATQECETVKQAAPNEHDETTNGHDRATNESVKRRGIDGNGGDATANKQGAIDGRNKAEISLLEANTKLVTTKEQLVEANKQVFTKIKELAEANVKLAEANEKLAKANVELAKANVELAKANVELAKANVELASADTRRSDVEHAKEGVKTAKEEVESACTEVKKPEVADLKRAQNSVESAKMKVKPLIQKVDKQIKNYEKKPRRDVERGTSDDYVANWEDLIKKLDSDVNSKDNPTMLQEENKKLCSSVYDLNTKLRATAKDQLANANTLHLSLSQKGRIVPVISKKLYHKIQERILPYDTNLSVLVIKSLFIVLFTYFCIEYVLGRQKSYLIDIVKVLTTITVSVLPYFFNVLLLTLNEQKKKTWNEMIKVNVKHIVDELDKDQELDKTILIFQQYICNAERIGRSNEGNQGAEDHQGAELLQV